LLQRINFVILYCNSFPVVYIDTIDIHTKFEKERQLKKHEPKLYPSGGASMDIVELFVCISALEFFQRLAAMQAELATYSNKN